MEERKEECPEECPDDSDGWVEEALQTDFMAANMLMRLSGEGRPPQKWLRRLPRSRQHHPSNPTGRVKDLQESARASPTTPLSFSGSSSPSASDEPTRPTNRTRRLNDSDYPAARAEAAATDTIWKMCGSKTDMGLKTRTKKRKTIAELREEENSLLMDRGELIKEVEILQATYKDLMLKNGKLKKLKLDLESRSAAKASSTDSPPVVKASIITASNLPPVINNTINLPDLNLLPPE
ncbi:hypothetical protein MRB53_013717 [Persea americana]|uniref:Uncharacterized protein n=1 Tax=Persea americana TaxID=3435 RepID=A0ACC2K903_PERAE|nr:hypothetical protein MRB53_013717 [Persea americana]